ncbi:MAG: sugar ABC transporter substrate-binding protein, partial [Anaerolineae bacterium]|nr:sugar ABC transporter substrate-binding protein [Anaerolineae bacterium]
MRKSLMSLFAMLLVVSIFFTACGGSAPTAEPNVEEPAATEEVVETEAPATEEPAEELAEEPASDAIEIRWFIGLGAGSNPEEIEREEAFVEKFNAQYGDKYKLVMDVVQ